MTGIDCADVLFMRHQALPPGEGYMAAIPGHSKLKDQSANSHFLNPKGCPEDVTYQVNTGERLLNQGIAILPVADILGLNVPHDKSRKLNKLTGELEVETDRYTFRVLHDPHRCMYPHCIIQAYRNNEAQETDIRNASKTLIRKQFAELAEKYRLCPPNLSIANERQEAIDAQERKASWWGRLVSRFRASLTRVLARRG